MKPNPFEKKLQELPWRKPSSDLKNRIFDSPRNSGNLFIRWVFPRQIHWKWAAALMMGTGIAGYGMGRVNSSPAQLPAQMVQTELRIIETSIPGNFFDLSRDSYELWPGQWDVSVQEISENNG